MATIMSETDPKEVRLSRRSFVTRVAQGAAVLVLGGTTGWALLGRRRPAPRTDRLVWQVDPWKCIQCGQCATHCVLDTSAVKCVHDFSLCGYCDFCTGFFRLDRAERTTDAEAQLCPTGAITRTLVEYPYFEYTIDKEKCIGCGLCVKGCTDLGNGSLYLQVQHDRCLNCNECAIAAACPADAYVLRPADDPQFLKSEDKPKP
jgi:electron transport complex protein RnfB